MGSKGVKKSKSASFIHVSDLSGHDRDRDRGHVRDHVRGRVHGDDRAHDGVHGRDGGGDHGHDCGHVFHAHVCACDHRRVRANRSNQIYRGHGGLH